MLNSEFIKDKFFDKYIKVEFAEMLRIIPPRNSFLQKCYIFPRPYIGIGIFM